MAKLDSDIELSARKQRKMLTPEPMPEIILGTKERIIKRYKCLGESRGDEFRETEIIITSKRLIKRQEHTFDKNSKTCALESIMLGDIKSVACGKYSGIRKSLFNKSKKVSRWLSINIEVVKTSLKFGKKLLSKWERAKTGGMQMIVYGEVDRLGEELMAIIFDLNDVGVAATLKKWSSPDELDIPESKPKPEPKKEVKKAPDPNNYIKVLNELKTEADE